jgi:RNA polymerase sigma-70 factor, ECF subfamily
VLEVIYLIFNEGYSASAGDDPMRPALCEEALRLGRIVAELAPSEAEVHELVALMEIQASRAKARIGLRGEPVLLIDQNRAQWDQLLIHRGLADSQNLTEVIAVPGPYVLQAEIAAGHARARTPEETDWRRIVELYGTLAKVAPSPVIKLDRALAMAMAFGPAAGLELVDALMSESERSLQQYHLLLSVRGDLLHKLNRHTEAQVEFERAASMARYSREVELLLARARDCAAKAITSN